MGRYNMHPLTSTKPSSFVVKLDGHSVLHNRRKHGCFRIVLINSSTSVVINSAVSIENPGVVSTFSKTVSISHWFSYLKVDSQETQAVLFCHSSQTDCGWVLLLFQYGKEVGQVNNSGVIQRISVESFCCENSFPSQWNINRQQRKGIITERDMSRILWWMITPKIVTACILTENYWCLWLYIKVYEA